MGVDTAAGSNFYIGPANEVAATQSAYEALSYVEVGEVTNISEFGDEANIVSHTALSDRRVRKFKGSYDAGVITLDIGHDSADTGQVNLDTALASDSDYAFKVTADDAGTGSPSSPSTYYFRGKVTSVRTTIGNAENIVMLRATIAINSPIIEVAAV